jgi:hypothetical protein
MSQKSPPPIPRSPEQPPTGKGEPVRRELVVSAGVTCAPRLLRLRDAPRYLGMDKNRFNLEVRPSLTVIPIGTQGVAFDRLDLDAWADEYERRNGCPKADFERRKSWDSRNRQASPCEVQSGISTKTSSERAFARALERATSGKPPRSWRDGSSS